MKKEAKMNKKIFLSDNEEEELQLKIGIDRLQQLGWVERVNDHTIQLNNNFFEIFEESLKDCHSDPHTIEHNKRILSHPLMADAHKMMETLGFDVETLSSVARVAERMLVKIGDLDNSLSNTYIAVFIILLKLAGGCKK
ncbi:hypothetical protein MBGDN05_00683 [Thermoplasmatales archaeon SCGC AB-539-N05]|nr:hypothetical protein MBGDN05_00683 [Thermoplasmatales archaeon SCGC AB-539-N05]